MHDDERRSTPMWVRIALVLGIVVLAIVFLRGQGGSNGFLSSGDCGTHLEQAIPKEQLKGVGVTLVAERCTSSGLIEIEGKPYVLVSVVANGQTIDGSEVREFDVVVRMSRQTKAGDKWQRNIPPSDIPKDKEVKKGSTLGYETQRKWEMPDTLAKARIVLTLKTDKGGPLKATHVFEIP